ncbi:MAG: response regulator [bacterium]|nr:response regulator [bacterium]
MKQILIIDDNESFLAALQEMLSQKKDITVLTATNGEEGLRVAEERKPNLIACDIMMPKINGIEFLRQLKLNPEFARVPVVMMTVLESMHMIEEAIKLGCVGYLEKHRLDLKDLTEKLLNFLQ